MNKLSATDKSVQVAPFAFNVSSLAYFVVAAKDKAELGRERFVLLRFDFEETCLQENFRG